MEEVVVEVVVEEEEVVEEEVVEEEVVEEVVEVGGGAVGEAQSRSKHLLIGFGVFRRR